MRGREKSGSKERGVWECGLGWGMAVGRGRLGDRSGSWWSCLGNEWVRLCWDEDVCIGRSGFAGLIQAWVYEDVPGILMFF